MNSRILVTAAVVVITLGITDSARAQSAVVATVDGTFHDYTADLDGSGAWQLVGDWSGTLRANGLVDVLASLSMVRSDNPSRQAHTHHVSLAGGNVSVIANGYRITGTATIASNGTTAGFSGSPVVVDLTGGPVVGLAKIALTFQGAAVAHFGDQPIEGVVSVP